MGWANGVMFPIFVSICHFLSALICGHLPQVIFRVSSNARTKTLRRNLKTASSCTLSTYIDWNLVLTIEIHYRAINMSSCVEKIHYQYVCVWSILGPRDHDLFGTRWKQLFWLHNVHFTMKTNNNCSLVLAIESTIWQWNDIMVDDQYVACDLYETRETMIYLGQDTHNRRKNW